MTVDLQILVGQEEYEGAPIGTQMGLSGMDTRQENEVVWMKTASNEWKGSDGAGRSYSDRWMGEYKRGVLRWGLTDEETVP